MTLNGPRGRVRRRITDDLLDEMTAWSPAERVRMFRTWLRGSLSLIHLHVLTVLEAEGPMAMGRLADALDVSVASATGIVDRMEQRELVERRALSADRRVLEVHPTAAGAAVFHDLLGERRAHLELVLGELTDRELASLLVGLRALHRARATLTPPADPRGGPVRSAAVPSAVRRPRVARATGG